MNPSEEAAGEAATCVVAEAVDRAVVGFRLLAVVPSVMVVAEAVAEVVIKAASRRVDKAVLYCCRDSPKSHFICRGDACQHPFSSARRSM